MTDKTEPAENDKLSPRDRATIDAIKESIGYYAEYNCVLTGEGDGEKIENDVKDIVQPYVDNLKIRTYCFIINELSIAGLYAQLYIKLVDAEDFSVIDFNITPT